MFQKFVSSLLCLLMFVGCSSSSQASTSKTADALAQELLSDLSIDGKNMAAAKARVIKGMVFEGDEIYSDAALYLSTEIGNSDSVGVFYTENVDECRSYIGSYLDSQKAIAQTYNADQVFKISNAVIEDNGKIVVFVVCDDIEDAKNIVKNALNS